MERFSIYNYLLIARRLSLLGVLAGLFFSSGEGISLLPFSHQLNDKAVAANFSKSKSSFYVLSISNSVVRRVKSFAHFQPKNPQFYLLGTNLFSLQIEETKDFQAVSTKNNFDASKFYPLNSVLSQPSGRAPPTI